MDNRLQRLLDRINRKVGGIGSALTLAFWLVVLYFGLRSMLFLH